jgi:hypothetical protein
LHEARRGYRSGVAVTETREVQKVEILERDEA